MKPRKTPAAPPHPRPLDKILIPVCLAVAGVWVVVTLTSLYTRDYQALVLITPVFMLVVGAVIGVKSIKGSNGK